MYYHNQTYNLKKEKTRKKASKPWEGEIMDKRKIILFGKSAYCLTLPQAWVKKNNFKKGDLLGVQETHRNSLELIPQNTGKAASIRKYVHEFIAAEVMDVTPDKIVINVLWNIKSVNLHSIIGRIDMIIRSSFTETIELLMQKNDAGDIIEMGQEIKRQVLLAKRATTYALNNAAAAQKFNMSSLELYYISYMVYFFGKIGEYITEISRIIEEAKKQGTLTPSMKNELKPILDTTLTHFKKLIESYNKQTKGGRFTALNPDEYKHLETEIDEYRRKHFKSKLPTVPEHIKMIINNIRETSMVLHNLEHSPK